MKRTLLVVLAAAVSVFGGCEKHISGDDLVFVTPPVALDKLNAPAGVFHKATRGVFVDPRMPKQFEEGHIPDAINLPLPEMEESAATVLAGYDIIIVYDADYSDLMARAGSKRLLALGFTDVFTLEGGLKAWKKEGYDVAVGPAKKADAGSAAAATITAGAGQ